MVESAGMQVLCDSVGADFPTFPQFVTMLRDYERDIETPKRVSMAIARASKQSWSREALSRPYNPQKREHLVTGRWVPEHEIRNGRPVMVLPSRARYYVASVEAGEAAIKSNASQGYHDFDGAHIEWER